MLGVTEFDVNKMGLLWWNIPVIPVFGRQWQEDCVFKNSLRCMPKAGPNGDHMKLSHNKEREEDKG